MRKLTTSGSAVMTKAQLLRFGELLLFEADELKRTAQTYLDVKNANMSEFHSTAALAIYNTHKAVLALAKETE